MRFLRFSIVLAVLVAGCDSGKQPPAAPQASVSDTTITIPTNSPQRAALTVDTVGAAQQSFVPLTGRLVWDDDVTSRVFTPFAGIVRKLLVEVNQPVTNGMALAEVQSADFGQAQAEARKAESDFRRTEQNLNRMRELFDHGAAPRKDLESAEADFASSRAERERAVARLAIYGAVPTSTNRDFLLPSPLDGVLVERNVTPGQEIRPDQMLANVPQFTAPLFTISDPTRLWVWLDVTEAFLPLVHTGQELTIRSKAFPGQTFTGKLDLIGDSLDPTTRTVRARGTVDNRSRMLKAEQYVIVEIPDANPTSLQIPSKAVFLRDNQYYVFLETGDGRFQRQPVKVGSEREGKVAILEGLKEGQRLVTDGCLLLQSLMDSAPKS
ncbi:MAG TPA: efflux RND transporter periplasmic adaptor subunit [Verrucomicrobiae bacterium]|nr:efflux RND transporter periplasmic adaptor subunit [Verrucomicrobiae bacterium]